MTCPDSEEDNPRTTVPRKIAWHTLSAFAFGHISAIIGLYLVFTSAMWKTILFSIILYAASLVGVWAGAHRLWSHRAYKAKLPLRILLAFFMTIAYQLDIFWWARDHRLHHKYTETNADPYNVKRGFFFSHIGWLMVRKHPDVKEKGKTIDVSDLLADPVVVFQRKYYPLLLILCGFVLPTAVPTILWEESIVNGFFIATLLRLLCAQHATFAINSLGHIFGNRPYTYHTEARENDLLSLWVLGEGFHNFHHAFPWDYAASEFGTYFNLSTAFINLMAWCGLAYDLRTVSSDIVRKRKQKLEGLQQVRTQTTQME